MSQQIAPSILNADFLQMGKVIQLLNESEADLIHLDIMDGVFVPNLTFGFPIINQINKVAQKPLDVHLMIVEPERYIEEFQQAGADILTIHYEACKDIETSLKQIRKLGMKASVSIKPGTKVSVLKPFMNLLDMVLIMSVEPGYGGQSFIEASYERVRELKQMIKNAGTDTLIQIDGGVSAENLTKLKDAGVDVFVVGTFIFKAEEPKEVIRNLKQL